MDMRRRSVLLYEILLENNPMINLLPRSEKKKLLKMYALRIGVVVLVATLVLEVLAAGLFFPSFYVLDLTTTNLTDELDQKKRATPEGETAAQQELATIMKEVAILKPSTSSIDAPPSTVFNEIFVQKPDGISINTVSYARSLNTAVVQIGGHAGTSEDMLLFQKNLKDNPRVASTQYASNNFIIKKTAIDFTMTITLK